MSIIKHVTLQKIVAHDFRYNPRMIHPAQTQFNERNIYAEEKLTSVTGNERQLYIYYIVL